MLSLVFSFLSSLSLSLSLSLFPFLSFLWFLFLFSFSLSLSLSLFPLFLSFRSLVIFCFFSFFKEFSRSISQAGLEYTMYIRFALILLSSGISVMSHHTWYLKSHSFSIVGSFIDQMSPNAPCLS